MQRVESGLSDKQLIAVHMELEALTEQLEQRTEEETRSLALAEARGRWWPGPGGRPVLVTWHPAALLRVPPDRKREAWRQWLADLRTASHGPSENADDSERRNARATEN